MKNESKAMITVTVYIFIMLIICVVAIMNMGKSSQKLENEIEDQSKDDENVIKEIVYVPIYTEPEDEEQVEEPAEITYNVKEYGGKIGVFSESGALIRIIDINIKSLPATDRDLLEKGFSVKGESAILSIVEDYTG